MSKVLISIGSCLINWFILCFRLIRWEIASNGLYFFVLGSKPMASLSIMKLFALMCSFIYCTTSGNCFVTSSKRLVNSLISPLSSLLISILNPSYLYSNAAGLPTRLNPSSMLSAFRASICLIGCPGFSLIFFNSFIPLEAFSKTSRKSLVLS